MEWFVFVVFVTFISGLVWVSVGAILHSRKSNSSKEEKAADSP